VAFAAARKWRPALAAFALFLVNGWLIVPFYLPAAPPAGGGQPVRALLANVGSSRDNHLRVRELIHSADPDLVVLLEVDGIWARELLADRGRYAFSRIVPRDDQFGIAMLSKLPVENPRIMYWGGVHFPSLAVRICTGECTFTLIATHPVPPGNTRMADCRNEHLRDLADFAAVQNSSVLVLGDLNTTPWSPHFRSLLGRGGLRDARRSRGVNPTWPVFFPPMRIPIDHCLVSGDISVRDLRTGPDVGSDHFPLIIDLSVHENGPEIQSPADN
jgi:endonuclease/exonuclease/phosphatase (EEP) superfamily protein YafD